TTDIAGSVLRLTARCSVVMCGSGTSTASPERAICSGSRLQARSVKRAHNASPTRRLRTPYAGVAHARSVAPADDVGGELIVESVARSVCGLVRTTTVLSRCDRGADEKWRRQSSEYGPVNARRASRESNEMRPLRDSSRVTLDGCCHHEAGLPRTRSRCATGPL